MLWFSHLLNKVLFRLLKQPIRCLDSCLGVYGSFAHLERIYLFELGLYLLVLVLEKRLAFIVEKPILPLDEGRFGFGLHLAGLRCLRLQPLRLFKLFPFLIDGLRGLSVQPFRFRSLVNILVLTPNARFFQRFVAALVRLASLQQLPQLRDILCHLLRPLP